jgi:hypothetical protein
VPPGAAPLPREAISFAYERQRHAGFVGRAALLARLDQELINQELINAPVPALVRGDRRA